MKGILCLVLVAALIQGHVLGETHLDAPNQTSLSTMDGPIFFFKWNGIQSSNRNDPVLGYKVNLWILENNNKKVDRVVNNGGYAGGYGGYSGGYGGYTGRYGGAFGFVPPPPPIPVPQNINIDDSVYDKKPRVIVVDGAHVTDVLIRDCKCGVQYILRVQAFTATTDGPLSAPVSASVSC